MSDLNKLALLTKQMPTQQSQTLYEILGLASRTASPDDIKKAYRKAALQHHPDRGGDKETFQAIQKSYDILSDPKKREIYDVTGSTEDVGGGSSGGGMPDFATMASMFFGFGGGGGGGVGGPHRKNRRPRAAKGPNKIHEIGVSLTDLYHGKKFTLNMKRDIFCSDCDGAGGEQVDCAVCKGTGLQQRHQQMGPFGMAMVMGPCQGCSGEGQTVTTTCSACKGRKLVERETALDVVIEPGMSDGDRIEFAGQCSESPAFGTPGDVVLVIRMLDDTNGWTRIGSDLTHEVTLTLAESLLGFERVLSVHPKNDQITILWTGGPVRDMETLRIPARGMPDRLTGEMGDLLILCKVERTESLTEEQRRIGKSMWPDWKEPEPNETKNLYKMERV